jgi:hypothetical protein
VESVFRSLRYALGLVGPAAHVGDLCCQPSVKKTVRQDVCRQLWKARAPFKRIAGCPAERGAAFIFIAGNFGGRALRSFSLPAIALNGPLRRSGLPAIPFDGRQGCFELLAIVLNGHLRRSELPGAFFNARRVGRDCRELL